jgi:lipopolysaccharide export system protein LptC
MKRIVKLIILFVVLTLIAWFIKKSMREGILDHRSS